MTAMRKFDRCDCLRPLTDNEQETFRTFADLLAGKEEGSASRLVYHSGPVTKGDADGLYHWEEACKIPLFPANREASLTRNEDVINSITSAFTTAVRDSARGRPTNKISVVEIGPGLWKAVEMKTVPFLKKLMEAGFEISEYIVIDPSQECADSAADGMEKHLGIPTKRVYSKFEDVRNMSTQDLPLTFTWGLTVWNATKIPGIYDETQLQNQLEMAAEAAGGYIVGTYLSPVNKDMDAIAYNDERNLRLIEAVGHKIAYDLRGHTDFDPSTFEPVVDYIGNGVGRHRMRLVSRIDQTINLGSLSYELKKGDGFTVNNSWRLEDPSFHRVASRSHMEVKATEYDRNIGAGVFLGKHIS